MQADVPIFHGSRGILEAQKGRFFNIVQCLLYRLTLAEAPFKREVGHRITTPFFLLQNYWKCPSIRVSHTKDYSTSGFS